MRIRLVFDERHLLTKEQRLSGLRRCWFLITPEMATVADVASELSRRFHLQRNCPDGIFFSMDDFVIPPFESTCFFREKDIVRVHKRKWKKKMITRGDNVLSINGAGMAEKETAPSNNEIMAFDTQEMIEIRNNQVAREENSSLRTQLAEMGLKRNHKEVEKPGSSKKKKKLKLSDIEKPLVINENSYRSTQEEPNQQSLQRSSTSEQDLLEKANPSDIHEASRMAAVATENVDVSKKTIQTIPERNKKLEENCNANKCEPNSGAPTEKFPSRSARRRFVGRQLKKEMKKQAAENMQSALLPNGTDEPTSENHGAPMQESTETQNLNMQSAVLPNGTDEPTSENHGVPMQEPTEAQNLVVARVVRPGHIRFESEGEDDDDAGDGAGLSNVQPNKPPMESFQWNGITNKAKGQKWGQGFKHRNSANGYNCTSSNWRNANNECNFTNEMAIEGTTTHIEKANIVQVYSGSLSPLTRSHKHRNNANGYNSTSSNWRDSNNENNFTNEMSIEKNTSDIGKATIVQLNFESLSSLTQSPKEGDMIVYRVVELSSTWCPDLSPFRVGEVKVYDPMSKKIILVPVPEYPIFSGRKEDNANTGEEDAVCQDDLSLYKEDGSLEIEFSSLVDVRLLRDNGSVSPSASSFRRKSNSSQAAMGKDKSLVNNWEMAAAKSNADDLVNPTSIGGIQDVEKNLSLNNKWDVAVENDAEEPVLNPTETEPNLNWETNGEVASAGNTQGKQNGWDTWAPNTSTPSWSYRALRGSALGPTIALLRGNNGNASRGDSNAVRGNGRGRGRGRGRRGRGRGNHGNQS